MIASKPTVAVIGTRGYPSYYGGFETAVRHLAPFLADNGWHVRVYGRPGSHLRPEKRADPRIDVVLTRGVESKSFSTLSFGLFATIHAIRHKPDVALIMNVANGYWLPLLWLRGIPIIVNVDGIEWERKKWNKLGRSVFKFGALLTARFADKLIFDAKAIEAHWHKRFRKNGRFIPYGADFFSPTQTFGVAEFTPQKYILLVARFVPENSVDLFLQAAPRLISELDVDVVIIGSAAPNDPLTTQAQRLADTNARVHLLGHVSDDQRLYNLWQNCALYFHGHTVGGTNPALVQAMSLGANIVAADTIYNREVLADAGRFFALNVDAVCDAAREAIKDNFIGAKARERARASYSWAQVCADYHETLKQSLARKRRAARG